MTGVDHNSGHDMQYWNGSIEQRLARIKQKEIGSTF
jgi:hypothetical protein